MSKLPIKAGTSKAAVASRRGAFLDAYMANGHNATQAAIKAGYSARSAASQGQRLLKDVEVSGELADAAREVSEAVGLATQVTLQEVKRLSESDIRKLYRPDGTMKDPREWDDATAAAVASIEIVEEFSGTGADRKLVGHTKKVKLWDKNAALEKALKHLGLYERDNTQRSENLSLQVVLVEAPTNERE